VIGEVCEKCFVERLLSGPPSESVAVVGNASYHMRKIERFDKDDTGKNSARVAHVSHICNFF
jgi:hypothetical protein